MSDVGQQQFRQSGLAPAAANWIADWIADLGALATDWMIELGSVAWFALRTFRWLLTRLPRRETLLPNFYQIGVLSLPVVALTGTFIGMVLAVQSYSQFRTLGLESRLGEVINMSLVRELGPVLAATMLAGRVGSSMAAELGTMRVTEQIDALASMGANPIHYLVVPRFLGLPAVDSRLDDRRRFHGRGGGGILRGLSAGDRLAPLLGPFPRLRRQFRPLRRGLQEPLLRRRHRPDQLPSRLPLRSGAQGVGRASTTAFVSSFVTILLLDLILAIGLDKLYLALWPQGPKVL